MKFDCVAKCVNCRRREMRQLRREMRLLRRKMRRQMCRLRRECVDWSWNASIASL